MSIIWRRHYISSANNVGVNVQSDFIQQISDIIKTLKKKEELIAKIIQEGKELPEDSSESIKKLSSIELGLKIEKMLELEKAQIQKIQNFKNQPYFNSKSYLYSILVRTSQICQASKQKYAYLKYPVFSNGYKQIKQEIFNQYQNLVQQNSHYIIPIIKKLIKFQNQLIQKIFPQSLSRCTSPLKVSLEPINKPSINERAKSAQSIFLLAKPTFSMEIPKKEKKKKKTIDSNKEIKQKQQITKIQACKKLIKRKKKVSETKEFQSFQKVYSRNFNKLYKILQVKQLQIEQSFFFRMEMQRDMKQRNEKIKSTLKQWFLYCEKREKKAQTEKAYQ